ncbi:cytochrome C peroxidase [Thalassotalea euphylliae]|uniref:Cytochrome C peroxidase n=1 Tax=Thalassotalea euphylliae TaxID=1655234 RepID=A0A3E0TMK7_9GAMM|nr:cytochrome-c peroxidase [Thalassotalea euphylliae]REL25275.1 cytochrome C peroxidase [Thalassotalea euphylliae]
MIKCAQLIFGVLPIFLVACGGGGAGNTQVARDYSATFQPLPRDAIHPAINPYSAEKAALGELLFWDPILSGDQDVACASCHHPDFGWADGRATSVGVGGVGLGPERFGEQQTPIHAPTVANTAFTGLKVNDDLGNFSAGPFFWDLRAQDLEAQALGPLKNSIEMLGEQVSEQEIFTVIEQRLQAIDEYQWLFAQAFPESEAISITQVGQAIATFQRTLHDSNTRFDRFLSGETEVFTEQEITGLNKFIDEGCARCHSGPMLSDNQLRPAQPVIRNKPAVRTASLRNIGNTAPYMHDGSEQTLRDAIELYDERGDLEVSIGGGDISDIEPFLRTLDSPSLTRAVPESVPSGLTVGGNIQ